MHYFHHILCTDYAKYNCVHVRSLQMLYMCAENVRVNKMCRFLAFSVSVRSSGEACIAPRSHTGKRKQTSGVDLVENSLRFIHLVTIKAVNATGKVEMFSTADG